MVHLLGKLEGGGEGEREREREVEILLPQGGGGGDASRSNRDSLGFSGILWDSLGFSGGNRADELEPHQYVS